MTTTAKPDAATVALEGPFGAHELRNLHSQSRIESLSLTKQPLITAKLAKEFSVLLSVRWFHLWCTTTRTAMRYVIPIPGLEELDVLGIRYPGTLENFVEATDLKRFFCGYLTELDLLEISRLPNLEQLSAQNAVLSPRALDALLRLPKLRELDLEETILDDRMAVAFASSSTIEVLDVAATRLTAEGLRSICAMSQLRSLDIWALNIQDGDLDMLGDLPNLEYLSIGGSEYHNRLTSKGVIPRLAALPSLKRVWLDGISLSSSEKAALEKRFEYVRN